MKILKILSTLAVKGALDELIPAFATTRGIEVGLVYDPTVLILKRIEAGERADVAITTSEGAARLVADGILDGSSCVDLARSEVGLAVKAGAPRPDISTVDKLRRALLDARSIVYSRTGASGLHFARVIAQLGVADEVNRKAVIVAGGFTAETTAAGGAELAVQQISELMVVPGVDIVGPLPVEVQEYLTFTASVFRRPDVAANAHELLAYLAAPEHASSFERNGLLPARSPR